MELAGKDIKSLQSNSHAAVHKLNEQHILAQRNTRRNTAHSYQFTAHSKVDAHLSPALLKHGNTVVSIIALDAVM